MKRMKIFGIGASILMILVIFIPVVNSVKINETEISSLGEGVSLEILDGPFLRQRKPVTKDTGGKLHTLWGVRYRIVNYGEDRIISQPKMKVVTNDEEEKVLDSWTIDLNLAPNGGKFEEEHDVYINIEELDIGKVDEGEIADELVKLECLGMDMGPTSDIERAVKFWKADKYYGPTFSQIAACLPRNEFTNVNGLKIIDIAKLYEKENRIVGFRCEGKTVQDAIKSKEFGDIKTWVKEQVWEDWEGFMDLLEDFIKKFEEVMDLFWEDFPNEFNNQRFGWTKNLSRYFINIVLGITLFLLVIGSAAYTIVEMPEFIGLIGWVNSWGNIFQTIKNGLDPTNLIGSVLSIETLSTVIRYASGLLTFLYIVGGIELFLFAKIKYDIEQLKQWRSKEPWGFPIKIHGRVDYVRDGEIITVQVNDEEPKNYPEGYGGEKNSVIFDDYIVEAEYPYKLPKKYQIKVSGDHADHKGKDLKTLGVLSYCYSGGKVYKWFQNEGWKDKSRSRDLTYQPSIMQNIIKKLSNIFDNTLIYEIIKRAPENPILFSLPTVDIS